MRLAQAVAAAAADSGLLLTALYRGRDVYPYPDLADGLRAIRRERTTTMLTLGGLTPDEVPSSLRAAECFLGWHHDRSCLPSRVTVRFQVADQ
jgi:hypothetical protein